jgi:hypothetical protein
MPDATGRLLRDMAGVLPVLPFGPLLKTSQQVGRMKVSFAVTLHRRTSHMNENPYESPKSRTVDRRTVLALTRTCPVCCVHVKASDLISWHAIWGRRWPCRNCGSELRIRRATAYISITLMGLGLLFCIIGIVLPMYARRSPPFYAYILILFSVVSLFLVPLHLLSGGLTSDAPPADRG